jgi:hypothetical protein
MRDGIFDKKLIGFGAICFALYLLAFYPIFNLHLVGDNYVTVGIYEHYLHTHPTGLKTYINYIFSDWGVQDTLEYLFYRIYGFSPYYRYLIALIIRFITGLSFIPLVYYMTKNKTASFLSAVFFAVTVIGIQAIDWSVSSISFASILLINLFLLSYLKLYKSWNRRNLFISAVLFALTIIIQPVRTIILPLALLAFEAYLTIKERKANLTIKRLGLFLLIFILLITFTHIGNSVSSSENIHWIESVGNKFSLNNGFFRHIRDAYGDVGLSVILTPIAQLGVLVFGLKSFLSLDMLEPGNYIILGLAGVGFFYLLYYRAHKDIKNYVVLGFILIFASLLPFWLKSPEFLYPVSHRYMIVPAAGLTLLFGLSINVFGKKHKWVYGGAFLIILINAFLSHQYLTNIESVRNIALTQKIRSSVYVPENLMNSDETVLYYFEPEGSDTLLYSLLWGFNYIVGYGNGIDNIWDGDKWNFAATDSWDSVISAYTSGEFFTLFEIPAKPVKLVNVYSYKLENNELVDTTDMIREKLRSYNEGYASNN